MNALIWVSLVWVCFPLRTLASAKLVASLYGAGVVGSLFTAPRGRGSSIPKMRTTFHASLGTLLVDHSGFTLLASGFCGEACVTACGGEPLPQRPRVESCLWAKFPQHKRGWGDRCFPPGPLGWPLPGPQASFGGQHKAFQP